jgi:hypothetical protein
MNTYGEPDVGNLLVRFDEDLREKRVASLSGYSTVLYNPSGIFFKQREQGGKRRGDVVIPSLSPSRCSRRSLCFI